MLPTWWMAKQNFNAKKNLYSQAHRSNASFKKKKKIQPDKYKNSSIRHVFSIEICLLIQLLSGWIFFFFFLKKGTWWLPLICKQTFQLPVGWEDISALNTKWLPQYPPLLYPPFLSEGKGREEGREERGWQKQLGGGQATRGRELTHMWQDQAVLLMGREKYRNFKYKADMWLSSNPAVSHLLYSWQAQ